MVLLTAAILSATILKGSEDAYLNGPVFTELKRFVGGTWKGTFPNGLEITHHFVFAAGGTVIRGEGTVTKDGKPVLYMHPNMGWDPVKKAVSYLDMHNGDTIYLGTVKLDNGWMTYNFVDALKPKTQYKARQRFTGPDTYEMELGASSIVTMKRTPDSHT